MMLVDLVVLDEVVNDNLVLLDLMPLVECKGRMELLDSLCSYFTLVVVDSLSIAC